VSAKNPSTARNEGPSQKDRIVAIAAELFAERGYRGITNREIAAAVGLGLGTIHHHVGTKPSLYQQAYESLSREADGFLRGVLSRISTSPLVGNEACHQFLLEVIDELVEFVRARPVLVKFLLRHHTESRDDFADSGPSLSTDLYETILHLLEAANQEGTTQLKAHPSWLLKGLGFLLFGYFALGSQGSRSKDTQMDYEQFKQFLYTYLCEMLGLQRWECRWRQCKPHRLLIGPDGPDES